VARNDLGKLQPLREALQQLWQEGLTRVHLLRTFFSRFGAIPLSRGIASARVGMLDPVLAIFTILSFHGTSNFARGHGGSRNEPWEATSPEDAPRREAKRTPGEEMWAWRERERERFSCHRTGGVKVGLEPPLDLGTPVNGKWKVRADTASLISPKHNSFSTLGRGNFCR
jgi:hypothetical protein